MFNHQNVTCSSGLPQGVFDCIFANRIMMWDGMDIDQISKLSFPIFRLWRKLTHRLSWPIRDVFNNSYRSMECFRTRCSVEGCFHTGSRRFSFNSFLAAFPTNSQSHRGVIGWGVCAWACVRRDSLFLFTQACVDAVFIHVMNIEPRGML